MSGTVAAGDVPEEGVRSGSQKDAAYTSRVRQILVSIHVHTNAGKLDAIAALAAEDVEVDENGTKSTGKQAFVSVVTAQNAGKGSSPEKLFHDFDVLVDGTFGAISYVWQGAQAKKYSGIDVKAGAMVRMRGMLFFELDDEALVTKVTSVYDEGVVEASLSKVGGYLYP